MCAGGTTDMPTIRDNGPSAGAERRHPQGFATYRVSKPRTISEIMFEYIELTVLCQPCHRICVSESDRGKGCGADRLCLTD